MLHTPKLGSKFRVIIIDCFDLGFIVGDECGRKLQLRVLEMNDEYQTVARESLSSKKLGESIEVFEFIETPGRVSQLSELELTKRTKEHERTMELARQRFKEQGYDV